MESDIFANMIQAGEWIEEFLRPDIWDCNFVDLFRNGMKILALDGDLSNDCHLVLFLQGTSFYADNGELATKERHLKKHLYLSWDKARIESAKQDLSKIFIPYRTLLYFRYNVYTAFFEMIKYKASWEKILSDFEEKNLYCINILREAHSQIFPVYMKTKNGYSSINFFKDPYQLDKEDGALYFIELIDKPNKLYNMVQVFLPILAKIFFKFLECGGSKSYTFCEYCNRLTIIKRKGRKKYCSDLCRTRAKNIRMKK